MAWDSSRPVPWERLMREWVIYVGVMAVVFILLFRDNMAGALAGLLISGPLYLGFGFVLAKLGYQRKTLKEMRTERAGTTGSSDAPSSSDRDGSQRSRPAPTSRTSTGRSRGGTKPNRRKR